MTSFRDNFFFVKFSIFFFIITVFGYWGIDLNSEELYIAVSFFFLVIVAVVLFRVSILFFFSGVLNRRYSRVLNDNLVIIASLLVAKRFWARAFRLVDFLYVQYGLLLNFANSTFFLRAGVVREALRVKAALLGVLLQTAVQLFSNLILNNFHSSFMFSGTIYSIFFDSGVRLESSDDRDVVGGGV